MAKEEKLISRIEGIIEYCKMRTQNCKQQSEDWMRTGVETLSAYYDGKSCTYNLLGEWLEETLKDLED